MKDRRESCVELNIHVKCDKCSRSESMISCPAEDKHDNNKSCVKINVFVECDDDKCR